MNHRNHAHGILKVLLVIAVFLAGFSIQKGEAALSKTPAVFSEDGRFLLVQADHLVLWDLETKSLVAKMPDLQCQQLAFLKQDGWVLCVGNSVTVYDWKNQAVVVTIPPESRLAYHLHAYSRETDRMVLRHAHEAVSVWQIGKKLVPLKHIGLEAKKDIVSVAASPDAKTLAIAQGHTIHLHDLSGTTIRDVTVEGGKPSDLLFAPDGSRLAASVGKTILLINPVEASIAARATLTSADGTQDVLTPEAFSRDGHHLVASNGEWSYALLNTDTGELVTSTAFTYAAQGRGMRAPTQLGAIDISPDAEYLVGQPEHRSTLQLWDLRTGSILSELCGVDCRHAAPEVSLLKWSPTGSKIVVAMQGGLNPDLDGKIALWDVQSHSPELVLDPSHPQAKVLAKREAPRTPVVTAPAAPPAEPAFVHAGALRASAASPTANLLVTTGDDRLLKIWDPGQGTLLRQVALTAPASALAFSADGAILAVGTIMGDVHLWDTQTWREFRPYTTQQGQINALQFLPGNRFLVVAGEQPNVPVVDLVTRTVVKELAHPSFSMACSPKDCVKKRIKQGEVVENLHVLDERALLLTASRTDRVVWDLTTWKVVERPAGLPEAWSGLGWKRPFVWMATRRNAANTLTLAVWDTKRKTVAANLDTFTNGDTEIVMKGTKVSLGASLAVDPLHRWAATRVGEQISIWDLSTQAKRHTFHMTLPAHLHWTSDGKHLVVVTLDRKILVWSAETMEAIHYLRDPSVTQ